MTHQCPGPECEAEVSYEMLACSRHWYQVPRPIRTAVWRTWANGAGAGTMEHLRAMDRAIASMRPITPKGART